MSYNRGGNMRRDGGRRSNDFGGGGNRRGGNYYDSYNSPMNPWEGGMVPGRSGSGGMMASGQTDLLSQLTSPEAQLALASNLINKLISQQQQSVPSLMNLGSLGSGGMSSYNDNYGNSRNFQDRRRGRMDQRRVEPYNKSGMNRRMGTDRRNLGRNQNRPGSDRKTPLSKSPKAQKDDKDKKDKQDAEKPNGDIKTESSDESKREEDNEDDKNEDEKKKMQREKEPPIPPALLYCHVCSKNMWDEVSFNKHMKGRPHQLMMDGLSDKYKLKVDLLRHEMRLAEQQREMELERKQRQGMKMFNHPREYCAMCDLHFFGHLISHRKNVRHQKLKAFLHPKCSHCQKEFSTRLEWDDHRLSFSHLMKVAAFRRATKPDIKDDEFDIDELVCPDIVNCGEMVSKEVPVLARHHSEEDVSMEIKEEPLKERDDIKKEPKDDEEKGEGEEKEKKEDIKEADFPQGIDTDPSKLPKYSPSVRIGKDLVVAVSGFVCRVCNRFMPSEEETQVHCRTLTHYNNYCNVVRAKARVTGRKKKNQVKGKDGKEEKDEEEKADEDKSDEAAEGNKTVDNEGNWKRAKVYEAEESMEVDIPTKEESKNEISDSVWEEVDKDIETVMTEISKESPKEEEEEEEKNEEKEDDEPPKRTQKGVRGSPRAGGRRRGK